MEKFALNSNRAPRVIVSAPWHDRLLIFARPPGAEKVTLKAPPMQTSSLGPGSWSPLQFRLFCHRLLSLGSGASALPRARAVLPLSRFDRRHDRACAVSRAGVGVAGSRRVE
jgi:hypothetical protein